MIWREVEGAVRGEVVGWQGLLRIDPGERRGVVERDGVVVWYGRRYWGCDSGGERRVLAVVEVVGWQFALGM